MTTDLQTDLEAFQRFLGRNGHTCASIEEAVEEFRAYQREIEQAKCHVQHAREQSARGESTELDIEDVIARGFKRTADKGIAR